MKIIEPSATLIDTVNAADIYAKLERCGRISHLSEPKDAAEFVRMLIKRGHESVLEHVSLTFKIVCDRAVQNELVRHRHASFTVESTRYCNYDDITVIGREEDFISDMHASIFGTTLPIIATGYELLLDNGVQPEIARAVLPLCLKSELYMTANLREWRHILRLRTSKAAHPQMRFIMRQVLDTFRDNLPVIVEDIRSDSND